MIETGCGIELKRKRKSILLKWTLCLAGMVLFCLTSAGLLYGADEVSSDLDEVLSGFDDSGSDDGLVEEDWESGFEDDLETIEDRDEEPDKPSWYQFNGTLRDLPCLL